MLRLFRRKIAAAASPPPATTPETVKGFTPPQTAEVLLATTRRQRLMEHIWQRTSLSREQFATLYRAPLERYAELT